MSESVDTAKSASDIPTGGWIDRWAPLAARPYLRLARLDRPIGTWLLLIPCWWGVALAVPSAPLTSAGAIALFFVLFAVGSLVMRGAGCTWNDFLDRDYDGRVARRSEEHTSELQSLMRISYAVFCLKKKKKRNTQESLQLNQ